VGRVDAAAAHPPLVVLRRGEQRAIEAGPKALHGVLGTEEVTAVADLLVGTEGHRVLGDLQRRELGLHHLQDLDVDDELLVSGHQAALQPPGRVHHPVGTGEERRQHRHQRLVAGLGVGHL
jgi:hypothetical protein